MGKFILPEKNPGYVSGKNDVSKIKLENDNLSKKSLV